jgi:hypothetical protein
MSSFVIGVDRFDTARNFLNPIHAVICHCRYINDCLILVNCFGTVLCCKATVLLCIAINFNCKMYAFVFLIDVGFDSAREFLNHLLIC